MQLADLFELQAQAVPKRALGSQLIQQRLGFVERVGRNILAFEQISKATLNFGFGKQGSSSAGQRNKRQSAAKRTPVATFLILLSPPVHARAIVSTFFRFRAICSSELAARPQLAAAPRAR